jgi:hypothetical protein
MTKPSILTMSGALCPLVVYLDQIGDGSLPNDDTNGDGQVTHTAPQTYTNAAASVRLAELQSS